MTFISSIIDSFLGPNKSNKIIFNENDSHVSRCPLSLLQKIQLQNPIISLVEETLYAHHELHGCSTLSLLAMWYFWHKEFLFALEDGCDIQDIIMHSQNVLQNVISALSNISVDSDSLLIYKKHQIDKALDKVPIEIKYSSRHFSPSQNHSNSNDEMCIKRNKEIEEQCFIDIINKLDHDEDAEIANLVFECWKKQISFNYTGFNTNGLLVCPIVLPCSSSTVLDGVVLKNKLKPLFYADTKKSSKNKTLIIKGSITFEHVHLGFSPKVACSLQKTPETLLISEKEIWREKCYQLILNLSIDTLLVKDDIDPEIIDFCLIHSVIVVPHIPWDALKILCHSLQHSPCTYLLDCNKESVLENLIISEWKPQCITVLSDQYFVVKLCTKNMVPLQTIILCHPSPAILENKEHQLWHLLSRITSAFNKNKLLPGGGKTEEWCSIYLEKLLQSQKLNHLQDRIIIAVMNGYQNYYNLVSRKINKSAYKKKFDDMTSKLSAWHSAMSLVLLTIQCDTILINGADHLTNSHTSVNHL